MGESLYDDNYALLRSSIAIDGPAPPTAPGYNAVWGEHASYYGEGPWSTNQTICIEVLQHDRGGHR